MKLSIKTSKLNKIICIPGQNEAHSISVSKAEGGIRKPINVYSNNSITDQVLILNKIYLL